MWSRGRDALTKTGSSHVGSAFVEAQPVDDAPVSTQPAEQERSAIPLITPAEGVPPVIADAGALAEAAVKLAAGTGPVAVDTERASGYRYSQRAYLIQLRRTGAGSFLIDPVALRGHVETLAEALRGTEWVLHAASQDLPCLAELDLRPDSLFDTELAGRLAGFERVALGTMVERLLGYQLEKGHGAADWSQRPLPEDWLTYAALDVELLIPLRDELEQELAAQGKLEWALEEFEAVRTAGPPKPRPEPWRRTSGIHRMRNPRQLAAIRALWEARDQLARERDIAPGRVLPDRAVVEAASLDPVSEAELIKLPVFRGRAQKRLAGTWARALQTARELPKNQLPDPSPAHEGPPQPNRWADRDPDAAARLTAARAALNAIAESNRLPVENLLQPELARRLCWTPPEDSSPDGVAAALHAGGARGWQVELTAAALAKALTVTAPAAD
jgi:ribonuclease D